MEWALFYRTAFLYLAVLVAIRIMGKREVGQLSAFDLVVAIMIAELAAMSMEKIEMPLYDGLIPIFTLVGLEILLSYLSMKSHTIRGIVDGSPSIVIANGKILEKELRKQRYNVSDLLGQLREKDVPNIADVQFAVLETSGELSVVLKGDKRPVTTADLGLPTKYEGLPTPLIFDGHIHFKNLRGLHLDEEWLKSELGRHGVQQVEGVLFASLDTDGNLYVSEKESVKQQQAVH
ncbi:MAG: DUF421 domain-containing protein [Bacillota bacterium]|nr:DUF421 domain-containing protein [Bacillota bacterium]MDW7683982.1 DUF421 domain-containing protein [Bacillota bacterium]